MKVIKSFFCIQEKKKYNVGDEYTGNRKDLVSHLEKPTRKSRQTKEKKIDLETK